MASHFVLEVKKTIGKDYPPIIYTPLAAGELCAALGEMENQR